MKLHGLAHIVIASAFFSTVVLSAQEAASPAPGASTESNERLKFVVIVTRHGVRSPTGKADQLNQFSSQPWPVWNVPPGYLTEHGAKLMTLFGAYDRQLLAKEGLLSADGCSDSDRITIVADSDERTRETGNALATGLMPGCKLETHALAEGTQDPIFHPQPVSDRHVDKQIATAALAGRIGNNPSGLVEAYRPELQSLENVLSSGGTPPKMSLFEMPSSLGPGKGDHMVDLKSPLGTAATLAENLLLEYTEGMPQVGWGRVDDHKLREVMQLHTASADLERRTGYIARAQAATMLGRILDSMRQAVTEKPVSGALGRPSDRLLILVGHDTNLTNISGALDLSWLIDGRRDDTPPGGALVFELWQDGAQPRYKVRAFFTAQTLDQMRTAAPLTLDSPPERVPIFIPGCSGGDFSCEWGAFGSTVQARIASGPLQ